MDNKKYLEKVKKADKDYDFDHDNLEYRQAKATEIIAEELCKFNNRANKLEQEQSANDLSKNITIKNRSLEDEDDMPF